MLVVERAFQWRGTLQNRSRGVVVGSGKGVAVARDTAKPQPGVAVGRRKGAAVARNTGDSLDKSSLGRKESPDQ